MQYYQQISAGFSVKITDCLHQLLMQLCPDVVAEGSQRAEEATKYKQSSAAAAAATTLV